MRPATKNYWVERGRSISFLEAPKFSLKKKDSRNVSNMFVIKIAVVYTFLICQFEQYEINTLIDIA